MADLVRDVRYLRYYYSSEDSLKDKDILKNQSFQKYSMRVGSLFLMPTVFQVWQILLVNNAEKLALYKKVRVLKAITLVGAFALGFREKLNLEYQWEYYNRFYPEPTELQKTLTREAQLFKESGYQPRSQEDLTKINLDSEKIYEQMYRLSPQSYPDPDENPNASSHSNHW